MSAYEHILTESVEVHMSESRKAMAIGYSNIRAYLSLSTEASYFRLKPIENSAAIDHFLILIVIFPFSAKLKRKVVWEAALCISEGSALQCDTHSWL